jgi:hypothetical protein
VNLFVFSSLDKQSDSQMDEIFNRIAEQQKKGTESNIEVSSQMVYFMSFLYFS